MNYQEQWDLAIPLAVAALGGLAVGIEREWSAKASGESPRFAGVRTFLLIGLLGALSVQLVRLGFAVAGSVILACTALLIVAAYILTGYRHHLDSTTEFAAMLVLAAGALAGIGKLAIASALNAFTALVLVEKSRIHSLVYRMRSEELSAGFRFAVLALVILPLLPEGPYGPDPGIRPRELWALVLLFSGFSFAGFIARRTAGPERGYRLAGLLGGLISSTLVTLNFSRESRLQPALGHALGYGVIAACVMLLIRAGLLTLVLNQKVGFATIPYLVIPFLIGLVILLIGSRTKVEPGTTQEIPKNPLRLLSAIQMVLAFQAALYLMQWVTGQFGATGILITSAFLGLTDVDTLVFTMAKQPNLSSDIAAHALTIGIFSNTLLKLSLTLLIGKGDFRLVASIGLTILAIATLAALLLL